jgi:hypothetical protein
MSAPQRNPPVVACPPTVDELHPREADRSRLCGLPPPTGGAMGSEPIEGDGWGAYVMLDSFSTHGTRDGVTGASPAGTESS